MARQIPRPPSADALTGMPADEVIDVLAQHWLQLSKAERDAFTHVLLEHPDRVAIFNELFQRASRAEAASKKARN
jgi:hypothetical protein